MQFLRYLGADPLVYVPNRAYEGYSFTVGGVSNILNSGARVVVSVDNGIASFAPVGELAAAGIDVIITDHHEWHCEEQEADSETREARKPILPECYTIVHPRLPGGSYPNPHLCGAGVAFKLAWGIGLAVSGSERVSAEFRAFLVEATALAALGTIADVVPLVW